MADTELKIKVSAQLTDTKVALEQLTKQLAQIAQGGTDLGAAATAGFARMEASAERAAAAARDVAAASARISDALDKTTQKAAKPLPVPKPPRAQLTEGVADQNAIQKAALKQQLVDLEQSHKAGLVQTKAYYQQRAAIQRAALAAEIAQARAMQTAATTQDARNRATTRIATLNQQRASISDAIPSTANATKDVSGLAAMLGKAKGAAAALGIAIGAMAAVKTFVGLADEAKMLEGRLKLATTSTVEYNTANAQLFAIAQRTRSEFGQVVGLYARLAMSTKALGTSQGELLRATETVSKAIKLSFTGSAESANAALMQLGQGLAAGTLRGDELNSVLEQAPRLANAIATGMGKSVGELKKMGEEGKITAEKVLAALSSQAATIDAEFKTLPRNIDGAMSVLKNSLLRGAGEIDKVTGITDALSGSLEGLSPIVESASNKIAEWFARAAASGGASMKQLSADVGGFAESLGDSSTLGQALDFVDTKLAEFFSFVVEGFANFGPNLIALIKSPLIELVADVKKLVAAAVLLKDSLKSVFTGGDLSEGWRKYREEFARVQAEMEEGLAQVGDDLLRAVQAGDRAVSQLRRQASASKKLAEEPVPIPMGPPRPPKPIGGQVDWREVEKARIAQHLTDIKDAHDLELMTTEEYYRQRLKLTERSIDLEIAQERKALSKATTADARSKSLTDIAKFQQQKLAEKAKFEKDMAAAAGGLVKESELEQEALRQRMDDIKRSYELSLVDTESYYAERLAIQQRQLELEIAEEEKALKRATTIDTRTAAKTRIQVMREKSAELDKQTTNALVDNERQVATKMLELRTAALASEHKIAEARKLELTAQYADLIRQFTAEGNVEGLGLIERLIGYEAGKAQLAQVSSDIEKVLAKFRAAEQSAANSVLLGTSKKTGAEQTREAAGTALLDLAGPRDELAKMAETSLEAKEALVAVDQAIAELNAKSLTGIAKAVSDLGRELDGLKTSFSTDIAFALRDNLTQLFTDIVTGSKRGTEALRDFAKNFAKSIAQIMAQILATRVAMALLKGGGGLLGMIGLGGGGSTPAAVHHAGGVVGAPGAPMRSVPITAFFGAPRLHQGGALGVGGDEVPAILQKGEEVLSKSDPRNVRNQGSAQGGSSTMLVTLHPDHNHRTMRDWLEGELARVAATS